jgi:protein phosphatase/serine/threonine-protein phosphatase Stp1
MHALHSFAVTDRGTVRPHNEDAFVDLPELGLFAVADGAGGHAAGELASGMLAEALSALSANLSPAEALAQIRLAVLAVHSALQAEAARRGDSMIASTLVVLLIRSGHFAALWAGDSRIYLLRGSSLSQVTRDHSLQALTHPQGNVITRAIGAPDDNGELDKTIGPAKPGDMFLLCSDGLTKVLDDATIAQLMVSPDPAQALMQAALSQGARDNVTVVVVRVPPEDAT